MASEVGIRVGAWLAATDTTVSLLGYGVYEGYKLPIHIGGFPVDSPAIKLDSGKMVYGYECWWGPEDKMKEKIGDRLVIEVDIDEYRKAVR